MSAGDRDSRLARALPAALLAAAAALSLWTVPALMRMASTERAARSMDAAAARLEGGSVLEDLNAAMRSVADAVEPAVVHVSVAGESRGRQGSRAFTQSGSGWVWDAAGHVVTNAHVVDGASRLEVQLHDGSLHEATLVGLDLRTDLAVLRVDAPGLLPARRSAQLPAQGDLVFAFGSPFEFRFSMSSGIVSGVGRSAGLEEVEYESFIQVDAAINPGNSGGPLTDVSGRVIGVNTAIATGRGSTVGAGQFAGIGLAIPMAIAEGVVEQLIEHGVVKRGFLGISMLDPRMMRASGDVGPALRDALAAAPAGAVVVARVTAGSPAESAGIRAGDVVVAVEGERVVDRDALQSAIGTRRPGSVIELDIVRPAAEGEPGGRRRVSASLGTLEADANAGPFADAFRRAGLSGLADGERSGVRGVLVGERGSGAAEEVPQGSLIVAVDGLSVSGLDDLWVRVSRAVRTGAWVRSSPAVALTVLPPGAEARVVEVPLR
jgi:S1-C subfamily serine protease